MYIISPHVYTHISKTLVLVKLYRFLNIQKKELSWLMVWDTITIKLKTGQVNRQFIHVGN